MSPDQFLARMKKGVIAPAYLFLGPEAYDRRRCREALLGAMLAPEEREEGLSQYDLRETSLPDIVDDARSLSLFTARRVIVAGETPASSICRRVTRPHWSGASSAASAGPDGISATSALSHRQRAHRRERREPAKNSIT